MHVYITRDEGLTIQQHLWHSPATSSDSSRVFAHLVFHGKDKAAMRFLMEQSRSSFLPLSTPVGESTVFNELVKKHPGPSPANLMNLVSPDAPTLKNCHPVIFDCLDGDLIRRTVLFIEGSAGPLGMDALGWRRLCTSFRTASLDLCLWTQMLCSPFSIVD